MAWAPVFKNASTSIKQAVLEAGWRRGRPYEWCFAVVRHPVDRWWSGVHQYTVNNPGVTHEELFEKARAGRFVFDQHTQKQVDQVPEGARLVRFEDASVFVESLGLRMRHMRARDTHIRAPDLIPAILAFYVEDLELYERSGG